MSTPPTTRAFGRLFQDEVKYMALAAMPPLSRLMYMTLVMRARPNRIVVDGISSLVEWTGLGDSTVRACLADLRRRGIIRRQRKPVRKGDGRGSFSSSTELVPFDEWPKSAQMVRVLPPTNRHDVPDGQPTNSHDIADGPTTNRYGSDDQPLPGGTTNRYGHEGLSRRTYPDSYPERDAPSEDDEDVRADQVVEDLTARWRSVRYEQGVTRFVDGLACQWLADAVRRLQRDGYSRDEIKRAIEEHVNEPFADPRDLPQWAESVREERLSRERDAQRAEAKRLKEAEHDALAERDRVARIAAGLPLPKLSMRRN